MAVIPITYYNMKAVFGKAEILKFLSNFFKNILLCDKYYYFCIKVIRQVILYAHRPDMRSFAEISIFSAKTIAKKKKLFTFAVY